jgi:alginate O-acetyltransferase complex protein AlgI
MSITNAPYFKRFEEKKLQSMRHIILLIASYVFYGYWDSRFLLLMFFITFNAYFSALGISKNFGKPKGKFYVFLGICLPIIILGIFKYFNFFAHTFSEAFGINDSLTLNLILPIGISFYTFQSMSYTIDVQRKLIPVEKNFIHIALYIAFFPQLVAGPIVKANEFLPQLEESRNISLKNFEKGIQIFLMGLVKKIILADHLSVFVDDVYRTPEAFNSLTIFLAVISYAIQIYFDFSGYSDMAVGAAKCFGYDLPRNFNLPYLSSSITEFWLRWHISLSSWFRQFVYIPLGGNRVKPLRWVFNMLVVWFLTGMWHGADWTFILWGVYYGVLLMIEKFYFNLTSLKYKNGLSKGDDKVGIFFKIFGHTYTIIVVLFGWIFFRAENMSDAILILKRLFTFQTGISQPFSWTFISVAILIIGYFAAALHSKKNPDKQGRVIYEGYYPLVNLNTIKGITIFLFVIGLIIIFAYTGNNPFVYFQF